MSPYDLTTLAALKAWLGLPGGGLAERRDARGARSPRRAARSRRAEPARPAAAELYARRSTRESGASSLRHWPVLQVTSVTLEGLGACRPPTAAIGCRRRLSPAAGRRRAAGPAAGARPVRPARAAGAGRISWSTYHAGYAVSRRGADASLAAAPFTLARARALRPLGERTSASSTPRRRGADARSPPRPPPGQYAVAGGVYALHRRRRRRGASRSPTAIVPQDLAQAALELAAERFRAAERIGLRSKSLGGQETIAYDASAISAPVLALLQPYRAGGGLMLALALDGADALDARLDALSRRACAPRSRQRRASSRAALADKVRTRSSRARF